jgi:hypothetical protein
MNSPADGAVNVGLIVGAVLGSASSVAIVAVIVCFRWRRKARKDRLENDLEQEGMDMRSLVGTDLENYV